MNTIPGIAPGWGFAVLQKWAVTWADESQDVPFKRRFLSHYFDEFRGRFDRTNITEPKFVPVMTTCSLFCWK
ncbi:hypothetical protein VK95_06350 [Leclercia sp. LK8]|nr:hypothetical protein VK95_06350 [Leclercia sp. LK8]